jgi:hypothetical protein
MELTMTERRIREVTQTNNLIGAPGDIIRVTRKSRGRFVGVTAPKGEAEYYVIGAWVSSYGSVKLSLIDAAGEEYFTTRTCTEVISRTEDLPDSWKASLLKWMERTYVPIIAMTVSSYSRKGGVAKSQTGESVLVRPTRGEQLWIHKRHCHPDDWELLAKSTKEQGVSIRIPAWLAKKNGVLGNGKKRTSNF